MAKCLRCQKDGWDPLQKCSGCGYSVKDTLSDPSSYQKDNKFPKHGLYFNGEKTVVHPNSTLFPSPGSQFYPGLNVDEIFTHALASGCTVTPIKSQRIQSIVLSTNVFIGEGFLFGEKKKYNSFRVVRFDDDKTVHAFPDMIRPDQDKEVVCTKCGHAYSIKEKREVCKCGHPISKAYFHE